MVQPALNLKRIRLSLLLCLFIWLTSPSAQASMWQDPDWEKMLKESELIALVEVVQGGKYVAKVRPLSVFKGKTENEFYVAEFNNHAWPADAIKTESFQEKERYFLFLARMENAAISLQFWANLENNFIDDIADFIAAAMGWRSANRELNAHLEAAKAGLFWSVWTPTAGDLPVEGEKVHYSLLSTSYPRYEPARDRAEFERFLKVGVAYHLNAHSDPPLLKEALQAVRKEAAKPVDPRDSTNASEPEQQSELSHWLATYFLVGGRAYDDVFETIAKGPDANARFILARLLGRMTEERERKLLLAMLKDSSSVVQGEVVRQLAKGDPEQVGSVLLAALAKAGEGGIYPQNVMDPIRNRLDGGKIEIIRALGELKYEPAAPALITLLENSKGEYDLKVLAEALEKMGNRDYASALEKALGTGKIRVYDIAIWARDNRVTQLKPAFERLLANPPDGTFTTHLSSVVETLGVIGDEATAVQLTAFLEKLNTKDVSEIHDEDLARALIGALGALRHKPARSAVEHATFYWFGVDSAFVGKPELLKAKQHLEEKLEREARKCLPEFLGVEAEALVFLENRAALAGGSETEPKYSFALQIDVRSQEHPELSAESLRARLMKALGGDEGRIGVTRWNGHFGISGGRSDARVGGRSDGLFLWRYGQYVQATRDPQDLRFVKFLMESGLAEKWDARDSLEEGLGSTSKP